MDKNTKERLDAVRERLMQAAQDELRQGDVSGPELLAIMAFVTGGIIAHQDDKVLTPQTAMVIVNSNIANGNSAAVKQFIAANGGLN